MRISLIALAAGILVTGCGPSAQEKDRIASRACGEIFETRKFESSKRSQIWNDAVDKIGVNGSYWSSMSDSIVELEIMNKGIFGAKNSCVESLVSGESPI